MKDEQGAGSETESAPELTDVYSGTESICFSLRRPELDL